MMKHFHPLFSTNAFAILSVGTLLSAIPTSLTINRQLVKRAGIPDLNELPPPEDDTAEHPSNQHYGLESIAPVKKPRSDLFRKKKMRRIEDLVRSIPPFSDQSRRQNLLTSAKERAVEEVNRAKSSTREKAMEERRKRSRLSSQRYRAKWTEEQKRRNYDRDNEQRKKKLNQLSENEKAVIRAQGRARYHKHKNRIRTFEHPKTKSVNGNI